MNRTHWRATHCVFLIGSLALGADAYGQSKQPPTTARQQRSPNAVVQRATNVQPPANDDWQPGQEPTRGAAQRAGPNQSVPAGAPRQGQAPAASQPRMPFALT